MIRLAFITDEATQDFDEALRFAREHGLQGLELRSVQDMPIDLVPRSELRRFRRELDRHGLCVPNLAGSFYKCAPDGDAAQEELKKLERLCDAADILGCRFIRGFAFFAPDSGPLDAAQLEPWFSRPAKLLLRRGKTLLLEADPSVNTTNHRTLAQLLQRLDSNAFGAIYDPGNDVFDPQGEKPYPDGYEAVQAYVRHIHVKDAVYDAAGRPVCVCIGQGLVGYPALLSRLVRERYDGWLSLETHYRKQAALSEAQMRVPQGSAFSHGGWDAAAESADALRALLEQAQKEAAV
ncbi:MAG TPA: sugar phosphate isomerase/epimerase [Candidatus Ruthenibacterium merdigallinarum]|nr:sugar phosphate isomerase/epimerase [Candidatus Ruthenibacterium merdigallinarum]